MSKVRWRIALSCFLSGGGVACAGPDLGEDGESEIGTITQHIAEEVPGRADVLGKHRLDRPGQVLASYALQGIPGCSATMIGPNTMITAGHCDAGPFDMTFRVYDHANPNAATREMFRCEYLLFTYPDTDARVFFCQPNAAGENPGDKYGYVDFALNYDSFGGVDKPNSLARARVGVPVYSVWQNSIDSLNLGDARIFSPGKLISVRTGTGWFTPNTNGDPCNSGPTGLNLRVTSDLWSKKGCSGSSQLESASNKLLVGPTSTSAQDAPNRDAMAIADYLWSAPVLDAANDGCGVRRSSVNYALLAQWGLNGADYLGRLLDQNADGVIDVQADVERKVGDAAKPFYWLGFESNRRNKTWNVSNGAFVTASGGGFATLDGVGKPAGWVKSLERPLPLVPGSDYRLLVSGYALGGPANVQVCYGPSCRQLSFANTGGVVREFKSGPLSATSAGTKLTVYVQSGQKMRIDTIAVSERSSSLRFETHDERVGFFAPMRGEPKAYFWGDGNGARPNFGLGVTRTNASTPLMWDAASVLALPDSSSVGVCFDLKTSNVSALPAGARAAFRIRGTTTTPPPVGPFFFPVSDTWTRHCLTTPWSQTGVGVVEWGVDGGAGVAGSYMVDNVAFSPAS